MKTIVLIAVALLIGGPAYAAPQWVENFETKHPKWAMVSGVKAVHATCFAIRHPKKFGKQCEEDGTNGLMSFIAGAANIGTTAIVGAKKF